MSEEHAAYGVVSEARQAIREISEHYAMIPDDLVRSGKLGPIAVYAALDRIARGNKTETEVAISFLSVYCELSTSTIQKALTWLSENQYIEIIRVGPGRQSNRYILPFRRARLAKNDNQISTEISEFRQQSNSNQEDIQEPPSGPSDSKESSVPTGSKKASKKPKEITEAFRQRMREKHAKDSIAVDDEIDRAMNHTASKKAVDIELYVQHWLNNSVTWGNHSPPSRTGTRDKIIKYKAEVERAKG